MSGFRHTFKIKSVKTARKMWSCVCDFQRYFQFVYNINPKLGAFDRGDSHESNDPKISSGGVDGAEL